MGNVKKIAESDKIDIPEIAKYLSNEIIDDKPVSNKERFTAIAALKSIGSKEAIDALIKEIDTLLKITDSPSIKYNSKYETLSELIKLKDSKIIDFIEKKYLKPRITFQSDEKLKVLDMITKCYQKNYDPKNLQRLKSDLSNENDFIKRNAVYRIGTMWNEIDKNEQDSVFKLIADLIGNKNPHISEIAVWALSKSYNDQTVNMLIEAIGIGNMEKNILGIGVSGSYERYQYMGGYSDADIYHGTHSTAVDLLREIGIQRQIDKALFYSYIFLPAYAGGKNPYYFEYEKRISQASRLKSSVHFAFEGLKHKHPIIRVSSAKVLKELKEADDFCIDEWPENWRGELENAKNDLSYSVVEIAAELLDEDVDLNEFHSNMAKILKDLQYSSS